MKLTHSAQIHYNRHTGRESPASGTLDLSGRWDDVFHTLTDHTFCLENPVDGYRVTCEQDAAFSSMIVCSFLEKAVCIEPWCAFPDLIQNNRFLLWTEPGQTCRLRVRWKIEALGEAKKTSRGEKK